MRDAVHLVIRGRVQGVGFRYATATAARRLGVAGWVRNLPDGAVEVVAAGAPDAVRALVDWCHHGPPSARVTQVAELPAPPEVPTGSFTIR